MNKVPPEQSNSQAKVNLGVGGSDKENAVEKLE